MAVPIGVRLLRHLPFNLSRTARNRLYRFSILFLTFWCYTSYHLSRKAISVVKDTWHPKNCSAPPPHPSSHSGKFTNGGKVFHVSTPSPRSFKDSAPDANDAFSASTYDLVGNDTNSTGPYCWTPFESDDRLGDMDFTFLICYAVAMFFSGHVGDRVSLRYLLFAGMSLSGLFTALLGVAFWAKIHSFPYFIAVQVFGGMAQSTGWPSVVAVMGNWFGKGNRGLVMGIWNAHTSVGNILGSVIPGFWDTKDSWGWAFVVPGLIIFGVGVIILLFLVVEPASVDCDPPEHHVVNINTTDEERPLLTHLQDSGSLTDESKKQPEVALSIWSALTIPGVAEFALCLFFAKFVSYIFLFWLPVYINGVKLDGSSIKPEHAADYSTLFDVGGIVGGIAAGVISDRGGTRALTCTAMLILAVPALFVFRRFGSEDLAHLLGLMFLAGAMVNGPYALITTAVSADLGNHELLKGNQRAKATVAAIIDGTGSLGAALGPYVTGQGLQHANWDVVIYICMGCLFMAAILLVRLCVKEVIKLVAERKAPVIVDAIQ